MLKIKLDPITFKAPVKITVPGQEKPVTVQMTFKYLSKSEQKALGEKIKDEGDQLAEIIEDWEGFDTPCSKEAVLTFIDHYRTAPMEIWAAYFKGLLESKVKN